MVRDDGSGGAGTRIVVVLNFAEEIRAKERARAEASTAAARAN
jgi:hypothetical protein